MYLGVTADQAFVQPHRKSQGVIDWTEGQIRCGTTRENNQYLLSWVLDRHKLTGFYLNSFAMDSVQVGKAVFVK